MLAVDNIELDIVEYCNLQCLQCSRSTFYTTGKTASYSPAQLQVDVDILKNILHSRILCIMGGEPLLSPELNEYVRILKLSGIADRLHIFTNGLALQRITSSTVSNIDGIFVSVYPLDEEKTKTIKQNIAWFRATYPAVKLVANYVPMFLKANSVEKNSNSALVSKIFSKCYAATSYSFHNGYLYRCAASRKKYDFLNNHRDVVVDDFEYLKDNAVDKLKITTELTDATVTAFLKQTTPLETCKWCLGCSGTPIQHTQIRDAKEDIATLQDLDFENSEQYISNTIASWINADPEQRRSPTDDKFFNPEHLKTYFRYARLAQRW